MDEPSKEATESLFSDVARERSEPPASFFLPRKIALLILALYEREFWCIVGIYLRARYSKFHEKYWNYLLALLSPTRSIADLLKYVMPEYLFRTRSSEVAAGRASIRKWKAQVLIDMNLAYRTLSTLAFFALWIGPVRCFFRADAHCLLQSNIVVVIALWYLFSRANEVAYAFALDAIRIARGDDPTSALTKADRIKLAMWSYYSLIIDFAIMYWILRDYFSATGHCPKSFRSIWDSLYFSGVTITTLGYGDITPKPGLGRFLIVYQVACGIALLVLSFAIYVGEEPKKGKES